MQVFPITFFILLAFQELGMEKEGQKPPQIYAINYIQKL